MIAQIWILPSGLSVRIAIISQITARISVGIWRSLFLVILCADIATKHVIIEKLGNAI